MSYKKFSTFAILVALGASTTYEKTTSTTTDYPTSAPLETTNPNASSNGYAGDCLDLEGFDVSLGKIYLDCGFSCILYYYYGSDGPGYGTDSSGPTVCAYGDYACLIAEYYCYGDDTCTAALAGCSDFEECMSISICKGDETCIEGVKALADAVPDSGSGESESSSSSSVSNSTVSATGKHKSNKNQGAFLNTNLRQRSKVQRKQYGSSDPYGIYGSYGEFSYDSGILLYGSNKTSVSSVYCDHSHLYSFFYTNVYAADTASDSTADLSV